MQDDDCLSEADRQAQRLLRLMTREFGLSRLAEVAALLVIKEPVSVLAAIGRIDPWVGLARDVLH